METTNNKNLAAIAHLSSLSQYCIPFGNYIFPILIWSSSKTKSDFIDFNGKQVINFQLSMFLYSLVIAVITIPIILVFIFSTVPLNTIINDSNFMNNAFDFENSSEIIIMTLLAIVVFITLKVVEFFVIIFASVKASRGEKYEYPLTIAFLK